MLLAIDTAPLRASLYLRMKLVLIPCQGIPLARRLVAYPMRPSLASLASFLQPLKPPTSISIYSNIAQIFVFETQRIDGSGPFSDR